MLNDISNLFFPQLCVHCEEEMLANRPLFCRHCLEQLQLIDPLTRCPVCFSEKQTERCDPCAKQPSLSIRAAALEYEGPGITLIHELKFGMRYSLAKDAAALMTIQLLQMGWPIPDLIVPVPHTRYQPFYRPTFLIAKEIGRFLKRPVASILSRRAKGFSQSGLNQEQRKQLSSSLFKIKKNICLSNKNILLVDDVITTGQTVNNCVSVLSLLFPSSIKIISICIV